MIDTLYSMKNMLGFREFLSEWSAVLGCQLTPVLYLASFTGVIVSPGQSNLTPLVPKRSERTPFGAWVHREPWKWSCNIWHQKEWSVLPWRLHCNNLHPLGRILFWNDNRHLSCVHFLSLTLGAHNIPVKNAMSRWYAHAVRHLKAPGEQR